MGFTFPEDFPPESCSRVLAERSRAAQDFEARERSAHNLSDIETRLREYTLRIFSAFIREAVVLGRQGTWTAERFESESLEFLRQVTVAARYEKGIERSTSIVAEVVSPWGSLMPHVQAEYEKSDAWREFQAALLEVADAQSNPEPKPSNQRSSGPSQIVTEPFDWENITITFLSDERVQLEIASKSESRNYAEMGFRDKRSGKPNQAWEMLRALAISKGTVPLPSRDAHNFVATAKRFERLRKGLSQHFGISSDPIPLDPHKGYCCRFNIRCAHSFEK